MVLTLYCASRINACFEEVFTIEVFCMTWVLKALLPLSTWSFEFDRRRLRSAPGTILYVCLARAEFWHEHEPLAFTTQIGDSTGELISKWPRKATRASRKE